MCQQRQKKRKDEAEAVEIDEETLEVAGEAVVSLDWVDDVLKDARQKEPAENEALARRGLKLARKAKTYREDSIFASLVDFYHWMPRQGYLGATARVSQNLGHGPAFTRSHCRLFREIRINLTPSAGKATGGDWNVE